MSARTVAEDDDAGATVDVASIADSITAPLIPVRTQQPAPSGDPRVVVRGVVLNAASGEPVARALVKLEGDTALGALTDGEGRFEIPGVEAGLQTFDVIKPGFRGKVSIGDYVVPATHTVRVAVHMPELRFSLAPDNAIAGRVTLEAGDPGVGIGLVLFKQAVVDGHAMWNQVEEHQSTLDGSFRFAGLDDGTYLLRTQAAFDNERMAAPTCDGLAQTETHGYPIVFYGGAADTAGAARIVVGGGQTAEANFTLSTVTLHRVQIAPAKLPRNADWQVTSTLLSVSGAPLDYPLHEDENTHAVCGYLPDGAYLMTMTATAGGAEQAGGRATGKGRSFTGITEFSVDGHAETHLRVPLAAGTGTPVWFRYEPSQPGRQSESTEEAASYGNPLGLSAARADGIARRDNPAAEPTSTNLLTLDTATPGVYWIQAVTTRPGICLGPATADGQSLGHSPWVAGVGGTGAEINVVLRTDCAQLKVQLAATAQDNAPGEAPHSYFYLVPEFDSIGPVQEGMVLQTSDQAEAKLQDLTPGTYRIVQSDRPLAIEYRNPAALERLGGQEITLEPNARASLVLEAPRE